MEFGDYYPHESLVYWTRTVYGSAAVNQRLLTWSPTLSMSCVVFVTGPAGPKEERTVFLSSTRANVFNGVA